MKIIGGAIWIPFSFEKKGYLGTNSDDLVSLPAAHVVCRTYFGTDMNSLLHYNKECMDEGRGRCYDISEGVSYFRLKDELYSRPDVNLVVYPKQVELSGDVEQLDSIESLLDISKN